MASMTGRPSFAALAPALLAPVLFGLGAVASKILLSDISPVLLAGILYLSSGLGLGAIWLLRPRAFALAGAPLERSDFPWLAGAVLCGGVVAPVSCCLPWR